MKNKIYFSILLFICMILFISLPCLAREAVGNTSYIDKTLNSVPLDPVSTGVTGLDQKIAEITSAGKTPAEKLKYAYKYIHDNISYENNNGIVDDFDTSDFKYDYESYDDRALISNTIYLLKYRTGNCITYASAFTTIARSIGFDVKYVRGDVRAAKGGYTVHSWSLITLNGKDYIFDPRAQQYASSPVGHFFGHTQSFHGTFYKESYRISTEGFSKKLTDNSIKYAGHVQNFGWQNYRHNGTTSGTTGQSLQMEAIKIELFTNSYSGGVRYKSHVQNIGWLDWVQNSQTSGTTGKGLRLEAIQIELYGEIAEHYDIYYRTHIEDYGWLGWAKNGASSGSEGLSKQMEAIQIVLVPKGSNPPGETANAFVVKSSSKNTPTVDMSAPNSIFIKSHVKNIGWQSPVVSTNTVVGTTGQSLRMEAISLGLTNPEYSGGIKYKSHVQNIGWQDWAQDSGISGTTGQGLRMEAIKIELYGDIAEHYDIYYRAHVQNIGWMNWVKNGEEAGTTGQALRIEAIEINFVKK